MSNYTKPTKWRDPKVKLFPYQVGFTAPPHDFDAAPSDFLRMAPNSVGVHGRMLHVPNYAHELRQRKQNFSLLEEFVEWNTLPKTEQRDQECGDNEFCDITTGTSATIYLSIHCMSDTESLYLNLHHDTDQVMMDIQLP